MTGYNGGRVYGPGHFNPPEPERRDRKVRNPYRGTSEARIYQRMVRELKDSPEGGVCWICGDEIDRSLPPWMSNDPAYWTADHDPPLAEGGSILEGLKPAHKGCNSSEGRRMQLDSRAVEHRTFDFDDSDIDPPSRVW